MDTLSNTTPLARRRKVAGPETPAVEVRRVGDYRLLRRLAAGGMSTVYLGYDETRRRLVALKFLAPELAHNQTCVDRFRQEAAMGTRLDHPNIVRCFDSGWDESSETHYLVMEYVAGRTAQQLLDDDGPMPVGVAARLALDIARGLQELHHLKYVHRDVKPGNIILDDDGRAKLADLGVAKYRERETELTSHDTGVGTPFYMPYEQMMNSSIVDERTDLFALGVTLYQLLTGRVPFPGRSFDEVFRRKEEGVFRPASSWVPELPPIVDVIIARMLDRNPHQRYRDAGHFIEILLASGLLDTVGASGTADEEEEVPAATRQDMERSKDPPRPAKNVAPFWTVQYRSRAGKLMRLNARVVTIERYYEEGRLPPNFLVLHENTLKPFRTVPEFQHLADHPPADWETPAPSTNTEANDLPPAMSRLARWGIISLASLVVTAMASTFYHFMGWGGSSGWRVW
ncbi:serine/threonine protein kinase [Zavarzinella formosa]|uniref:serine/threonine protein kinase n=1 Tax=Zavarzinella formosa TaxID=360055 RepID=UPI000312105A|nr:serine/threonine-protein kinase [Zavarzinella formosa]